jgi:nucleoside-diphosphate-sugar epimerase
MKSDVEFVAEKSRLRPQKSEVFRLWCDNSKIRELTGFKPQYSIEEGLKETITWFSKPENLTKFKLDIYNV